MLSSQEGGSQIGKHSTTNDANKAQQTNSASLKWSSNGPLESSLEGIMNASANTEESSDYSKKRASKRASIFSFLRGGNSAALKELASDKDEGMKEKAFQTRRPVVLREHYPLTYHRSIPSTRTVASSVHCLRKSSGPISNANEN